jgi:peptidylprolyl isomerase
MSRPLLLVLLIPALALAACGGASEAEKPATGSQAAGTATAAATPDSAAAVAALARGISKDTAAKPKVPAPQGDPPAQLVKRDIVRGKGKVAKAGSQVLVQYVGVSWSTGQEFDASWDRGQAFPFQLGAGMVIRGWDQGVAGMRQGGRRLLVIPPELGYGAQGSPPAIGPDETLVFVVDLQSVG